MVITVNELCEACEELKAKGMGNKEIYISSDDEGNSFHGLYYLFTTKQKDIKEIAESSYIETDNIKNIVILG